VNAARRLAAVAGVLALGACNASLRVHNDSAGERAAEALFSSALADIDNETNPAHLDSATAKLERYLATDDHPDREREAMALLRLARDAQRLARIQSALLVAKANADEKAKDASKHSDDDALKEIQRLKDELAKANEELERIKKRLAAPKPPAY